jgi:zinc transport system substrate-binding protein
VRVVVSIQPLVGLVKPLLPEGSRVEAVIPVGASEHGYEAPPSVLAALNAADVVVLVGLGLEPQVEKFLKANPRTGREVVRLAEAAGVAGAHAEGEKRDGDGHGHGHGEGCDHGPTDPHLWLDPVSAAKLLPVVGLAVEEVLHRRGVTDGAVLERLDAARASMEARLARLDGVYRASLATAKRKKVVVGHDAFGWLARRYGFETVAIAGLNAGEPTPGALAAAAKAVKEHGLPVVFVEPQLSKGAAERIAQRTGTRTMVLDPLGKGDYFELMEKNLAALLAAMGGERVEPKGAGEAGAEGAGDGAKAPAAGGK